MEEVFATGLWVWKEMHYRRMALGWEWIYFRGHWRWRRDVLQGALEMEERCTVGVIGKKE